MAEKESGLYRCVRTETLALYEVCQSNLPISSMICTGNALLCYITCFLCPTIPTTKIYRKKEMYLFYFPLFQRFDFVLVASGTRCQNYMVEFWTKNKIETFEDIPNVRAIMLSFRVASVFPLANNFGKVRGGDLLTTGGEMTTSRWRKLG